jgi:flagellar protein FlgJ
MPIDSLKGPVGPYSLIEKTNPKDQAFEEARLKKALSDFEALFIQYLMKCMRETVPRSDLFGGGSSRDLCQSMLDEELSRNMARAGGIGLTKLMLQKMLRQSQSAPSEGKIGPEASESSLIQKGRAR